MSIRVSRLAKVGFLGLIIWLVSGCAGLPGKRELPAMPLLPPSALGQHWQLTQTVAFRHPALPVEAMPTRLLAAWSVTAARLDFAGLTATGQSLFKLGYDGELFTEEYSPVLSVKLPGRDIIAQLQLAYWPLAAINTQLRGTPWRLVEAHQSRQLYLGDEQVLDIQFLPGAHVAPVIERIEISNLLTQYRLSIQTLSREMLP